MEDYLSQSLHHSFSEADNLTRRRTTSRRTTRRRSRSSYPTAVSAPRFTLRLARPSIRMPPLPRPISQLSVSSLMLMQMLPLISTVLSWMAPRIISRTPSKETPRLVFVVLVSPYASLGLLLDEPKAHYILR